MGGGGGGGGVVRIGAPQIAAMLVPFSLTKSGERLARDVFDTFFYTCRLVYDVIDVATLRCMYTIYAPGGVVGTHKAKQGEPWRFYFQVVLQ